MAKSREITIPDNSYIEFSVLYVELLEIVKSMGYEKIIIVIENLDRLEKDQKQIILNIQSFVSENITEQMASPTWILTYSEFEPIISKMGNSNTSALEKLEPIYYFLPPLVNSQSKEFFGELLGDCKFKMPMPGYTSIQLDKIYDFICHMYNLIYITDVQLEHELPKREVLGRDKLFTPRRLETLVSYMKPIAAQFEAYTLETENYIEKIVITSMFLWKVGVVRSNNNIKILQYIDLLKNDFYVSSVMGSENWPVDVLQLLYRIGKPGDVMDIFVKPLLASVLTYGNDEARRKDFNRLVTAMPDLYKPIEQIYLQGNSSNILMLSYLIEMCNCWPDKNQFFKRIEPALLGTYSVIDFNVNGFDLNSADSHYAKCLQAYITLLREIDIQFREHACNQLLIKFEKSYKDNKNAESLLPFVSEIFKLKQKEVILNDDDKIHLMYDQIAPALVPEIFARWSDMPCNPLCEENTTLKMISGLNAFLSRLDEEMLNVGNTQELAPMKIAYKSCYFKDKEQKLVKPLCKFITTYGPKAVDRRTNSYAIGFFHDFFVIIHTTMLWILKEHCVHLLQELEDILIKILDKFFPQYFESKSEQHINQAILRMRNSQGGDKKNNAELMLFCIAVLFHYYLSSMELNDKAQRSLEIIKMYFKKNDLGATLLQYLVNEALIPKKYLDALGYFV
jgi:hypothetical protein